MKWIVYVTVLERFGRQVEQIRRAPILEESNGRLVAEQLGGKLLAIQRDVRKAESLRRLIELQRFAAGDDVAEWSAPEEWEQDTPRSLPKPKFVHGYPYPRLAILA
jgi:hypothetical protein